MGGAPLALAFSAGMLASVNPCGFSMLPAYLSFFLGLEGSNTGRVDRAVPRALAVGAIMTAGFVAVFGVMGVVLAQVGPRAKEHLPWVTIVIGAALVVLGVSVLRGRQLSLPLPKLAKGTGDRHLGAMFLFGISYALSSLSCTIGVFTAAVSTTFSSDGVLAGVATFVAYGLGMGAIVTALTVAVALARSSIVRRFRQLMRWVNTLTGALLVLVGTYLAYYGWYEIRQRRGVVRDPVIDRAFELQGWVADQIDRAGATRLGLVFAAVVLAAVATSVGIRAARRREA